MGTLGYGDNGIWGCRDKGMRGYGAVIGRWGHWGVGPVGRGGHEDPLPAEEHSRGKAALRRGEAADGRGGAVSDNDSVASSRGGSDDADRRRAKPKGGVSRRRVGKARSRERQRGEWGEGGAQGPTGGSGGTWGAGGAHGGSAGTWGVGGHIEGSAGTWGAGGALRGQ